MGYTLGIVTVRYIRLKEAAERLGYRPSYAREKLPRLLPTYRLPGVTTGTGPLVVMESDLEALLDRIQEQPASVPA